MRFAVVNLPLKGHIGPSLRLVRHLRRLGHDVLAFGAPADQREIEQSGAAFVGYARPFPPPNPNTIEELVRCLVAASLELTAIVADVLAGFRPDAVLHGIACPWGKQAARLLGMRTVALGGPLLVSPRRLHRRLGTFWDSPEMRLMRSEALQRYRQVLALEDTIINAADLNIMFTSREFQPEADAFGPEYLFVGPCLPEREAKPRARSSKRLVYASLGTLFNSNAGFFRDCVKVTRSLDVELIMSMGSPEAVAALEALPAGVSAYPCLDQLTVLGRAAAFITHGGFNSVSEACWHNVPMVLVPQASDQRAVAARVDELGAGIHVPMGDRLDERLELALGRVLSEPGFATTCAQVGATLRRQGGLAAATDAIIGLCEGRR